MRLEWWSVTVALALTAIAFSFSLSLLSMGSDRIIAHIEPRERVEIVQLAPPFRAIAPEAVRETAAHTTTVPRVRDVEDGAASAEKAESPVHVSDSLATPEAPVRGAIRDVPPAPAPEGQVAFAGPRSLVTSSGVELRGFALLDSAARDSIVRLKARNDAVAWRTWRMPSEIVEAEWRRESERIAARVAEKRPWIPAPPRPTGTFREQVATGGGSIPAPLFEAGPSRGARRRDSTLHAGNLARLQRIFERARQDSAARARRDSIARASNDSP